MYSSSSSYYSGYQNYNNYLSNNQAYANNNYMKMNESIYGNPNFYTNNTQFPASQQFNITPGYNQMGFNQNFGNRSVVMNNNQNINLNSYINNSSFPQNNQFVSNNMNYNLNGLNGLTYQNQNNNNIFNQSYNFTNRGSNLDLNSKTFVQDKSNRNNLNNQYQNNLYDNNYNNNNNQKNVFDFNKNNNYNNNNSLTNSYIQRQKNSNIDIIMDYADINPNFNKPPYGNQNMYHRIGSYNNINNNFNTGSNLNPRTVVQAPIKVTLDFLIRARGLDNVGATCYMNATLQCFYHVKSLSENIINDNRINKNMKLTLCYKELIEELAGCKNRNKFYISRQNLVYDERLKDSIAPIEFKNLISEMNPLFKGVQANDSKDLILFLLETMDKELTLRNNNTQSMEQFIGDSVEDLRPEKFKKFHNSIFSEIFYGFQRSVMKCKRCGNENPNFNVMNFLIFPLEKVYNSINKKKIINKNYMLQNKNNYNMNNYNINNFNNNNYYMNGYMNSNQNYYNNFSINRNNINSLNPKTTIGSIRRNININNNNNEEKRKISLHDCFKSQKNLEDLTGTNQIYCNVCNSSQDGVTFEEIYQAPNVLIIILNRGRGNTFECELDFPKDLDLSQYISNPSSPKSYELIGVISHLGESSMEGHFIAYCKHFDGGWYLFNDGIVTQDEGNGVYNGIPYILFYKNKNWNQ